MLWELTMKHKAWSTKNISFMSQIAWSSYTTPKFKPDNQLRTVATIGVTQLAQSLTISYYPFQTNALVYSFTHIVLKSMKILAFDTNRVVMVHLTRVVGTARVGNMARVLTSPIDTRLLVWTFLIWDTAQNCKVHALLSELHRIYLAYLKNIY